MSIEKYCFTFVVFLISASEVINSVYGSENESIIKFLKNTAISDKNETYQNIIKDTKSMLEQELKYSSLNFDLTAKYSLIEWDLAIMSNNIEFEKNLFKNFYITGYKTEDISFSIPIDCIISKADPTTSNSPITISIPATTIRNVLTTEEFNKRQSNLNQWRKSLREYQKKLDDDLYKFNEWKSEYYKYQFSKLSSNIKEEVSKYLNIIKDNIYIYSTDEFNTQKTNIYKYVCTIPENDQNSISQQEKNFMKTQRIIMDSNKQIDEYSNMLNTVYALTDNSSSKQDPAKQI